MTAMVADGCHGDLPASPGRSTLVANVTASTATTTTTAATTEQREVVGPRFNIH